MNAMESAVRSAHRNERISKILITMCGIGVALVPFLIGGFLLLKGSNTFTIFHHGIAEFLFSGQWAPDDSITGGGSVGASIFICGSLTTCGLALLFSLPISMFMSIFMTEIVTPQMRRLVQPAVELFTGIPSVVYGWIGLTVLIPFLRKIFPMPFGFSLLAGGIVLAVMIFPTITTMSADAMAAVPKSWREASYALGATRWETIYRVVLPAARSGIFTGIILGLSRALGEALAVAMVIGSMKAFPTSLFMPTSTLTTAIASDMGGAMEGGEYSAALWTMALMLFVLSFVFIYIIHCVNEAVAIKGRS